MLRSFKQFYISLLMLSGIIVGSSVLACVPNDTLNANTNVETSSEHSYQASIIVNKIKRHNHSHMARSLSTDLRQQNADDKEVNEDCRCCEFGGCSSCIGCAGSCSAVLFSTVINNNIDTTPLGRFSQQQAIYASISLIPLKHPPKQ